MPKPKMTSSSSRSFSLGPAMFEEGRGGEQLDADFGQLVADRAEDRFGIALLEAREQEHRFEVGTQTEEVAGCDLTGHDRPPHVRLLEKTQQFSELADAQPFDLVGHPRRAVAARGSG